jgi:acetolactate synthase small subunit
MHTLATGTPQRLPFPLSHPTACFSIVAKTDPGVMPRVMALFAKRALIPSFWCSRVADDEICIDLQMQALDEETAHYLVACLGQLPSVSKVLLSHKR